MERFYAESFSFLFDNTSSVVLVRFYAKGFGFLFDNTSSVVLVFASSFPFIFCLLLFAVGCDFNWLRLFTNSVYSLCSFSAHLLFVIKLELVFLLLGV